MANFTQNLIIETFENMLEHFPLEKITVTALIKECNIGRNTFYYHYEDIYALLDDALQKALGQYETSIQEGDWKKRDEVSFICLQGQQTEGLPYLSFAFP